MSDWTPVSHEHIADEPKPEAKPEPKDPAKEKAAPGTSFGLSLNVPTEMVDRMGEIADAQALIIDRLEQSSESLEESVAALTEVHAGLGKAMAGIVQGQQDIVEQMAAQSMDADRRAAEAKAMFEASKKQGDALLAFLKDTVKLMGQVEKAIVAPRKVTLKRDENGLASEAVSRVQK